MEKDPNYEGGVRSGTASTWRAYKQTFVSDVDNCYETNATSALCDRFLVERRLLMRALWEAECPFNETELCAHTTNRGLGLSRGLRDQRPTKGQNQVEADCDMPDARYLQLQQNYYD